MAQNGLESTFFIYFCDRDWTPFTELILWTEKHSLDAVIPYTVMWGALCKAKFLSKASFIEKMYGNTAEWEGRK